MDTAIVFQNLVLAARNLGLGTCWIGAFRERVLKSLLKIPDVRVVTMTPRGYPAEEKRPITEHKPLNEIIATTAGNDKPSRLRHPDTDLGIVFSIHVLRRDTAS